MSTEEPAGISSHNNQIPEGVRNRLSWRPPAVRAAESFMWRRASLTAPFLNRTGRLFSLYGQLSRRVHPGPGWLPVFSELNGVVPSEPHTVGVPKVEINRRVDSRDVPAVSKTETGADSIARVAGSKTRSSGGTPRHVMRSIADSAAYSAGASPSLDGRVLRRPRIALARYAPIQTAIPMATSLSDGPALEEHESVIWRSGRHSFPSAEGEGLIGSVGRVDDGKTRSRSGTPRRVMRRIAGSTTNSAAASASSEGPLLRHPRIALARIQTAIPTPTSLSGGPSLGEHGGLIRGSGPQTLSSTERDNSERSHPRIAISVFPGMQTPVLLKPVGQLSDRASEGIETGLTGIRPVPFPSVESERAERFNSPRSHGFPMISGLDLAWRSVIKNPPQVHPRGEIYGVIVRSAALKPAVNPSPRREVSGGFPAIESPLAALAETGRSRVGSPATTPELGVNSYVMEQTSFNRARQGVSHGPNRTEAYAAGPAARAGWAEAGEAISPSGSAHPARLPGSVPDGEGAIQRLIERTILPTTLPGLEIRLLTNEKQSGTIGHQSDVAEEQRSATAASIAAVPTQPAPTASQLNINEIADRVYQALVRRQRLERERKGLY